MIGERKEERRAFTKEERMQILKNTGGICACCGKKLTETNMTVEHIIPLSRGGTNDMENLTALCELHNKLKDNLLYMPFGFYAAIRNKPSFFKMEEHVRNWFKSIADEFDLERFPLISPQFIIQIDPIGKIGSWKKIKFNPQMTLKWEIVGRKAYKGVEAETGINIENIRMNMNLLMKGNPDSKAHPVPLYCLKKVNSKKILAVIAVSYWKVDGDLCFYIPWHCMSKTNAKYAVFNFLLNIVASLTEIAGQAIPYYTICSEYEELANILGCYYNVMPDFLANAMQTAHLSDPVTGKPVLYVCEASRIQGMQGEQVKKKLWEKLSGIFQRNSK